MVCLWKGKAFSLLYDMSQTLQNFTFPRALQLGPIKLSAAALRGKKPVYKQHRTANFH